MATNNTVTPADIPNIENQITGLQGQQNTFQQRLNSSPTALGGEGVPLPSDVAAQESLQKIQAQIQTLQDQKLKAQWYPPANQNNNSDTGSSSGLIGTTLDYLSRPLYGIVGATKHFVGQGTGSLQQDVADNMVRNKQTFGDVLRSAGTPWAVSAPLGLALDIGLDPVNWLTMGEGAIVPRLAVGAYKGLETGEGIAKGLSLAAKSSAFETAATLGRWTPYLKNTEAFANFGEKALAATDAYEGLTGRVAANIVQERGMGVGSFRIGLGDVINRIADATPGGQNLLKNFVYDPVDWVRQARIKDIMQDSLGTGVDLKGAINASVKGQSIEPFMQQATEDVAQKIASAPAGKSAFDINMDNVVPPMTNKEIDLKMSQLANAGMDKTVTAAAPEIVRNVDAASSILKDPAAYISADPVENALRIASERTGSPVSLEDVAKIVNSGALDQTGIQWFDKMMGAIKDFKVTIGKNDPKIVEVGKRVMDSYDRAMGVFRVAKVGASPTSWVNAVAGNMLMTHMANGDIGPEFLGRLKQAWNLYRDKPGSAALLDDLLMNAGGEGDVLRRGLADNRTAARGTFGDISFLGANYNAERILRGARDAGIVSASTKAEDIAPMVKDAMAEIMKVRDAELGKLAATLPADIKAGTGGVEGGTSYIRNLLKSGKTVARGDVGAGMLSNEMFNSNVTAKMFEYMAEKAKDPAQSNLAWKLLDFTFNKMSSGYESIDQTYKMATFLRATVDGYTLNQLRQMRHIIDINPEELTRYAKQGQYLYRLPAKSAIELANVMYLNYNAMPAAVRVLRNFPLLGSPFVSFMYGMALKTGQTLAYNPSAFNKVNFALKDFGGSANPLEKKAIYDNSINPATKQPYNQFYSYLQQPGMYRLPDNVNFFSQNPVYINMASMIPYYSLNMFNPSQASYGTNSVSTALTSAIQSSPLLKDPVGSTLFDYLIQPLILGEATQPQGQFGQPIYPVDATGLQKFGYGLRSAGEAFVPNIFNYAGLITPESVAQDIPSYRWRQLAEAKVGKNQLGISGKEPAASRTIRTLFSASGIPVQAPVNTTFSSTGSGTAP